MLDRAEILRDDPYGHGRPESRWDPIWLNECSDPHAEIHALITFNASAQPTHFDGPEAVLEDAFQWLNKRCGVNEAVSILAGHGGANPNGGPMVRWRPLDGGFHLWRMAGLS